LAFSTPHGGEHKMDRIGVKQRRQRHYGTRPASDDDDDDENVTSTPRYLACSVSADWFLRSFVTRTRKMSTETADSPVAIASIHRFTAQ